MNIEIHEYGQSHSVVLLLLRRTANNCCLETFQSPNMTIRATCCGNLEGWMEPITAGLKTTRGGYSKTIL
jgi:hypothetical protein